MEFKITEPGVYKRRCGGKFEIVGRDSDGFWIGKAPDSDEYTRYGDNGILRFDRAPHTTTHDAVEKLVEPKRVKGWVNLYPGDTKVGAIINNVIHETKEEADRFATERRIACIKLDILEGEGLEGGK